MGHLASRRLCLVSQGYHGNLVISGGAGLYYDRGELFTYLSQPAGSSIGGPFGVTESSPAGERRLLVIQIRAPA